MTARFQGVAYYPDYFDAQDLVRAEDGTIGSVSTSRRLRIDFGRMLRCGISAVRIGEFAWSQMEPYAGAFDFSIFAKTLDIAHEMGIRVWLCTPTACPPKWLVQRDPAMLPQSASGSTFCFGSRRHYDPCNGTFRRAARVITEAMVQELGSHPAVVGWQIDNELGHHGSSALYTDAAEVLFQDWLGQRYQSIDALNQAWFTCFWSQYYASFRDVGLPRLTLADHNPHLLLDFKRFCSSVYVEFLQEQTRLIKQLSPNAQVTHNFNSSSYAYDICPWELSDNLDEVGFDHYQEQYQPTPAQSQLNFTLMRSLKNKAFLVLEQQPVQVNWQSVNTRFTYDWLFLWAVHAYALGARGIFYFSWQRFLGGAEAYHDGILNHDVRIPETKQELVLKAIGEFAKQVEKVLPCAELPVEDVLIIHNTETIWVHSICAQTQLYQQANEVLRYCRLLSSLGLGYRLTNQIPDLAELKQYQAVLLPGYAFGLTDLQRALILEYLNSGGKVISFPRTGVKDCSNRMLQRPLELFDKDDFYFYDFGALGHDEQVTVSMGEQYSLKGEVWLEDLVVSNPAWESLGGFVGDQYRGPAAIRRRFDHSGCYIHFAFIPVLEAALGACFAELTGLQGRIRLPIEADCFVVPWLNSTLVINFAAHEVSMRGVDSDSIAYSWSLSVDLECQHRVLNAPQSISARTVLLIVSYEKGLFGNSFNAIH